MCGSIFTNMIMPIYYLQYVRNENADIESPFGSRYVPPLEAFFTECNFVTLPLIAWALYRTVKNRHVLRTRKTKRSGLRRRANSFESRATGTT